MPIASRAIAPAATLLATIGSLIIAVGPTDGDLRLGAAITVITSVITLANLATDHGGNEDLRRELIEVRARLSRVEQLNATQVHTETAILARLRRADLDEIGRHNWN